MSISQSGPNLHIFSLSFQIVKAMQRELANSGLSPEEILAKTMLLQKAMQGDQCCQVLARFDFVYFDFAVQSQLISVNA